MRYVLFLSLLLSGGCALLRSNPLNEHRGGIVLVFDSRYAGKMMELCETLEKDDVRASVFFSGVINRSASGLMDRFENRGHTIGLSGQRGLDPKLYVSMYGEQKYFQDEIVPQLLGSKNYNFNLQHFAFPRKGVDEQTARFLVNKGFCRVIRTAPAKVPVRILSRADLDSRVLETQIVTAKDFPKDLIASLAKKNAFIIVTPERDALPQLLSEASRAGVPFLTLSDLD